MPLYPAAIEAASTDRTKALRKAIERMPDRPFNVAFWDGSRVEGTSPGATLTFTTPRAIGRVLRSPGELGLGRAYALGEIEIDDLDAVIGLLGRWKAPKMGPMAKLGFAIAAVRAMDSLEFPGAPASELQPSGRAHSKKRDADAVKHHYDVSNEFFELFLDESMTYSCALFEGAGTIEEAQFRKLDVICRKLDLEPGQRFLDIGCGWGSLAMHAAREYGVHATGITISDAQAELAKSRVSDAGLSDSVEIEIVDYRDLGGRKFDAIASIGMVEHVGEVNIDEYARCVAGALEPSGRSLIHGIIRVPAEKDGVHKGGDFSNRYVFPDGELLNISRTLLAFERAGLEVQHVENIHQHYAETLRYWVQKLESDLEKAERVAGPERLRVWRLYLRAARNGFETGQTAVCQSVFSWPISEAYDSTPIGLDTAAPRRVGA